jgi:uncharacterized protein YbjT (DUF2867 family)
LPKADKSRAADLDPQKIAERFGAEVESVRFDFTDPATYPTAFNGVERMFFMRPPHISNIQRDMVPAMDAAKRAGVKYVVFLSLIGIEKTPYVPHYKVETYLREVNLQTTFLRCSFFFIVSLTSMLVKTPRPSALSASVTFSSTVSYGRLSVD